MRGHGCLRRQPHQLRPRGPSPVWGRTTGLERRPRTKKGGCCPAGAGRSIGWAGVWLRIWFERGKQGLQSRKETTKQGKTSTPYPQKARHRPRSLVTVSTCRGCEASTEQAFSDYKPWQSSPGLYYLLTQEVPRLFKLCIHPC